MKLQKATSIALFAVLELAAEPGRQLAAADIADRYGISLHHLAKVLRDLARAGIVESARGVGGGYRFVGNAKRLTLADVIALFEPVAEKETRSTPAEETTDVERALRMVLDEIDEHALATFRSITLSTMLKIIGQRPWLAALGETEAKAPTAPA